MQRKVRKTAVVFMAATGVIFLLFAQWRTDSQPVASVRSEDLTKPLPGLTAEELADFDEGLEEFEEVETVAEGLGPVFNGKSCAECHSVPSVGGSEPNVGVARETRIGRLFNGVFDPLDGSVSVDRGGGLLQQRAINLPGCSLNGEVVPPEATFVSLRNSPPLFGAGLMEAIPEATIVGNALHNGGRPNRVFNPDTGGTELGRFGWKAQVATLHQFAGDAYLNEMGITNPTFPDENLPHGQPIPPGCDTAPVPNPNDLEDDGSGVTAFENFMKFLAPAPRRPITDQVRRGEQVFSQIGCASCHVPTMTTGNNPVKALSKKPVNLFSDLLLHDMGPGLADDIVQGLATGNEFRTAPLWGLSRRDHFLHDGRSNTIEEAILLHGGEAQDALDRFVRLSQSDHDALLAFLGSL
jgi:CxxC motif-containing protein (DUF1111 family)